MSVSIRNQIFQGNIKGLSIIKGFFGKFLFLSHELSRIESSLILSFGDDAIQFSAVSGHFPKQGVIHIGNKIKHFNFFYIPILDDNHNVKHILISLIENTEIRALRKTINHIKRENSITQDIIFTQDKKLVLKKLLTSKQFVFNQISEMSSKFSQGYGPSFKNMLFYEFYKALPDLPFLKDAIQNV